MRKEDGLVVTLHEGPELIFGDATHMDAKWVAATRVLADPEAEGASYVDVRLPGRPAAGGLPAATVTPVAPAGTPVTPGTGAAATAPAGHRHAAGRHRPVRDHPVRDDAARHRPRRDHAGRAHSGRSRSGRARAAPDAGRARHGSGRRNRRTDRLNELRRTLDLCSRLGSTLDLESKAILQDLLRGRLTLSANPPTVRSLRHSRNPR